MTVMSNETSPLILQPTAAQSVIFTVIFTAHRGSVYHFTAHAPGLSDVYHFMAHQGPAY